MTAATASARQGAIRGGRRGRTCSGASGRNRPPYASAPAFGTSTAPGPAQALEAPPAFGMQNEGRKRGTTFGHLGSVHAVGAHARSQVDPGFPQGYTSSPCPPARR
jgi:hypothetical protein